MSATTDTSATTTARRDGYAARDRRTRRARGVTYALLGLGLLVTTAPFVWMGLSAFKTPQDLSASPPVWIPTDWTTANFSRLFDLLDVPRYFFNSTLVALLVTLCNLLFCSMLGYALAKLNFAGKKVVFGVVMAALMVPGNLMLMPQFVMVSKMNLLDTYAGLVLPSAAGAFGVFLMRQFMSAVPDELLEAARVDGAREWYIFWRIVIPQVKPALATLSIFVFLGSWNNFLWPLIATNDVEKYTLPVALATFATDPTKANGSNGVLMAGAFLVVLPVLAVFIVLQRYFTQSIATAGIK